MATILLYHQIADVPAEHDPLGLSVPPLQFERQMAYLHRAGYHCLDLAEALQGLRRGWRLDPKSIVLTFDDGYRDLYTVGWPIMQRYGFTATVFLVTNCVGMASDWAGQCGPAAAPLLSWDETREMVGQGLSFGCHTHTHPHLTRLSDDRALYEIRHSQAVIAQNLDRPIDLFSYPYFDFDARIERLVARSGFYAACGGERGRWGMFSLWRVQCLRDETTLSFALKVGGWRQRLIRLREQTLLGRVVRRMLRGARRGIRGFYSGLLTRSM